MSEDRVVKSKSVKASKRKVQGALISALLEGDRGTGKSRFILELHKYNVECAYEKLDYGKRTAIEWRNFWEELIAPNSTIDVKERKRITRAAKRCLMCVIDFDMEGQEQLLMRPNIMPMEIADSWEKWPVTGTAKDCDEEEFIHRFDDGHNALNYYLRLLREHAEKYPEFASQRALVVEDCGEFADSALDYYFFVITHGRTKDFAEHFAKTQTKAEAEGKFVGLFQHGQRDTFGMINLEIKDFIHSCVSFKRDIGYNFYATTRMGFAKATEDKAGGEYPLGKTYIYEGYMDLIIKFVRIIKKKKSGKVKEKFIIDTEEGAKNRMCPSFHMKNDGPRTFFEEMTKKRDNDKVLGAIPEEAKKEKEVIKDENREDNEG